MSNNHILAAEVKRIFSDLDDVIRRVQREPTGILPASVTTGHYTDRLELIGAQPDGDDTDPDLPSLIEAGGRGLEKIRRSEEEGVDLSPIERIGIEAIIHLEGRPALLVKDDSFEKPPAEWDVLNRHREVIENNIPRVGRIEVEGHPRLDWVGTGFLVAPDVIMTNRHVAVEFSQRDWIFRWKFMPEMTARIDLKEEINNDAELECELGEVIGIHPLLDLALLRVMNPNCTSQLSPLSIQSNPLDNYLDREVYTIGYPAWDGRRNEPIPMRRIFSNIYNVKRLQPGRIMDESVHGLVFRHDCSTLGGNSGSCVFDLESGQVLGLHYSGRYRQANKAIPLWKLTRNRLLKRAGVNFA